MTGSRPWSVLLTVIRTKQIRVLRKSGVTAGAEYRIASFVGGIATFVDAQRLGRACVV